MRGPDAVAATVPAMNSLRESDRVRGMWIPSSAPVARATSLCQNVRKHCAGALYSVPSTRRVVVTADVLGPAILMATGSLAVANNASVSRIGRLRSGWTASQANLVAPPAGWSRAACSRGSRSPRTRRQLARLMADAAHAWNDNHAFGGIVMQIICSANHRSSGSRLQDRRMASSSAALVAFLNRAPERPFTRRSHSLQVAWRIGLPSTTLRYE